MIGSPRLRVSVALLPLVALVVACGGPAPPAVDTTSKRSLASGEVVGFTGSYGSHVWRGIPYAAPPVGELRWRAPRPVPNWEGVHQALATGSACPQFASVFSGEGRGATGIIGEEDCLYLDVYAPRVAASRVPTGDQQLPVMLWIHGGGNSIGRAGFYDGGNLATTGEVVVVAINYRLGPLGWFRHAALLDGEPTAADRSGNFGTLDTIRALEWVQENIAAFGGDPGNVTVFGESAGARNVLSLMLSKRASGLFHRAVMQSGGFGSSTLDEAERFTDDATPGDSRSSNEILARLLVRDGSTASQETAKLRIAAMAPPEQAAYLRGKSHQELLEAYLEGGDSLEGMIGFPQHFRDGTVLPSDEPRALLARGEYNQVPVILGTNRDENKLFLAFDPTLVRWRLGLFPQALDEDRYQAQSDHQANAWKARSVDGPAAVMRAIQGPTVYAYRWDWDEEPGLPLLYDGAKLFGASHGLEISFVFGHWDVGPDTMMLFGSGNREEREALSAQMMSYWAEFAYSGSPGRGRAGDLMEWPAWDDSDAESPRYIVLDTAADGGLHLASETFTLERVVGDLLVDPRLPTARSRCSVLRNLTEWEYLSIEQYAATQVCQDYAYEAYPWPEVALRE